MWSPLPPSPRRHLLSPPALRRHPSPDSCKQQSKQRWAERLRTACPDPSLPPACALTNLYTKTTDFDGLFQSCTNHVQRTAGFGSCWQQHHHQHSALLPIRSFRVLQPFHLYSCTKRHEPLTSGVILPSHTDGEMEALRKETSHAAAPQLWEQNQQGQGKGVGPGGVRAGNGEEIWCT